VDLVAAPELGWIVQEALNAPLPPGWSAHSTASQCVYFFNEVSGHSTWQHPMDATYLELLAILQAQWHLHGEDLVQALESHLLAVQSRAAQDLQHWSGPYTSSEGEYFYHELKRISVWHDPCQVWQDELALRRSVLHRYILGRVLSDCHEPEHAPDLSPADASCCSLTFHSARSSRSLGGLDDLDAPMQMPIVF
jgi:hypothetical protein